MLKLIKIGRKGVLKRSIENFEDSLLLSLLTYGHESLLANHQILVFVMLAVPALSTVCKQKRF